MTSENMKSALAFAVFSFLLVLIATFGVVYRYDLYPGYGTLVQISPNLYHNPGLISTDGSRGPEHGNYPPETNQSETKINSTKSVSDFFNKVVAVFASVKFGPSDISTDQSLVSERPIPMRDHVKLKETRITPQNNIVSPMDNKQSILADGSKLIKPGKLLETTTSSPTATPRIKSFYDRLIEVATKGLDGNIKYDHRSGEQYTYEIRVPRPRKIHNLPPWIEDILEDSSASEMYPRTFPGVFAGLGNFLDELDEELSSDSFEIPEIPFVGLLDGGIPVDVSEESESDQDFFFNRNPKHFIRSERLPEFPHPVIDFPMTRRLVHV